MIIINTIDDKTFSLNGITFAKIYQPLAQGIAAIGIYSIFDTRQQLQNSTTYSNFEIDGMSYATQALTIAAILDVVYTQLSESDFEALENRVDNLEENQVTGVNVYSELADLPASGTLLVSYKVSNDPDPSKNGYYHWTGAAYIKDADITLPIILSEDQDAAGFNIKNIGIPVLPTDVAPYKFTESEAIQLLRAHKATLVFSGFADTSTSTPSHVENKAYIASESGSVFGIAVTKGQFIVDDGSVFTAESFQVDRPDLPFYKHQTFGDEIDTVKAFILDIGLFNIDKTEAYGARIIGRNRTLDNTWILRVYTNSVEVCNFIVADYVPKSTIEIIKLNEIGGSGISGYAVVNWDALADEYYDNDLWAEEGYQFDNEYIGRTFSDVLSDIISNATNLIFGNNSSKFIDEALHNTSFGHGALKENKDSNENSAFGFEALENIDAPGEGNAAMGYQNQKNSYGGFRNSSFGANSLQNLLHAMYNCAFGYQSQLHNLLGLRNSSFGYKSMLQNKTGWWNTAFGYKTFEILNGTGELITNWADAGGGKVTVTSASHGLSNGAVVQIIGTAHFYDKGIYTFYDGEGYVVSDVTGSTFQIVHAFIDPSTLYKLGSWRIQSEANGNTACGYAAGNALEKGSNCLMLGFGAEVVDPNGDNQLSIQNSLYGDLVNHKFGFGIQLPKSSVHGTDIAMRSLSADPADPEIGDTVQWTSDGSDSGDAGDVMMKINVGGVVKVITLVDYSAS